MDAARLAAPRRQTCEQSRENSVARAMLSSPPRAMPRRLLFAFACLVATLFAPAVARAQTVQLFVGLLVGRHHRVRVHLRGRRQPRALPLRERRLPHLRRHRRHQHAAPAEPEPRRSQLHRLRAEPADGLHARSCPGFSGGDEASVQAWAGTVDCTQDTNRVSTAGMLARVLAGGRLLRPGPRDDVADHHDERLCARRPALLGASPSPAPASPRPTTRRSTTAPTGESRVPRADQRRGRAHLHLLHPGQLDRQRPRHRLRVLAEHRPRRAAAARDERAADRATRCSPSTGPRPAPIPTSSASPSTATLPPAAPPRAAARAAARWAPARTATSATARSTSAT